MSSLIRLNKVISITGLSKSSIYEMMSKGYFPKNVRIGKRAVGWIDVEIYNWIETKISLSRKAK